ncbi:IucA/IucC family C-terminal-domain containing protein [Tistrella mobilis]|uniref:IucA/IucC family C-terminal-domain containing protein n=1 Tax=Tistrella mobilis TaxID=171437 RepID=UPI003558FD57
MTMIAALQGCFTGSFTYLSGVLAADDPAVPTPTAAELLARPDLTEILTRRCGPAAVPATRRAAASMWSQYYCGVVGVPVVAAAMLAGRRLPITPDTCRIACDPTGQPCGFRIAADHQLVPAGDPLEVIDSLISDHLLPVFDRLAEAGGLVNPLKGMLTRRPPDEVQPGEGAFRRKICCLRYQLEGFADCGTLCPLPGRGDCG